MDSVEKKEKTTTTNTLGKGNKSSDAETRNNGSECDKRPHSCID